VLAEGEEPGAVPGRDEGERVGVGQLDPGSLDRAVVVGRVDEQGAARVRAACERADERDRRDVGRDADDLTGLDVGAGDDREVG
jgi:hypothetical protein